jgi:hypothetical protein
MVCPAASFEPLFLCPSLPVRAAVVMDNLEGRLASWALLLFDEAHILMSLAQQQATVCPICSDSCRLRVQADDHHGAIAVNFWPSRPFNGIQPIPESLFLTLCRLVKKIVWTLDIILGSKCGSPFFI